MVSKKNQAAKKVQQAQRPRKAKRLQDASKKVSPCVKKYLTAKVDPFKASATGACIPQAASGATFKFRTTARIALSVKNAQGSVLLLRPSPASGSVSVQHCYTDASRSADSINFEDLLVEEDYNATGSPFNSSQFTSGALVQRCVGWGIRTTSTSAPLLRQGIAYGYVPIQEGDSGLIFPATNSLSNYKTVENSRWSNVSKSEKLVLIDHTSTTQATEMWFPSWGYREMTGSFSSSGPIHACAAIYLPPAGTSGTDHGSYEIEFVAHWECKGSHILGLSTPNAADPVGYQAGLSAVVDMARSVGRALPPPAAMMRTAMQAAAMYSTGGFPTGAVARNMLRLEL